MKFDDLRFAIVRFSLAVEYYLDAAESARRADQNFISFRSFSTT